MNVQEDQQVRFADSLLQQRRARLVVRGGHGWVLEVQGGTEVVANDVLSAEVSQEGCRRQLFGLHDELRRRTEPVQCVTNEHEGRSHAPMASTGKVSAETSKRQQSSML